MKSNTLVSVIVPVYNVPEKYLIKCVNSIINQSFSDLEIILVDDGTPNTSGRVCDELATHDNRITVIHQENRGLCGARNAGVKIASGKWISFVDGDDWIESDTYEILYNEGEKNNVDVVMFGYTKDYPSRSIKMNYDRFFDNKKVYRTPEDIKYLRRLILEYNANCAMAPTKFIRKSVIEKYNIYHDEGLRQGAEGIEFNIRLFSAVQKAEFIDRNFYHYVYNDESITTTHSEENHKMVLNCFKKIKEEINLSDSNLKKAFFSRMKYVILTTAISGYFSPSNKVNYKEQKKGFKNYLRDELVIETLSDRDDRGLGKIRLITLWLIRLKLFILIKIISRVRVHQKEK